MGALIEWEVKVFATVVVEVQAMESKELSAVRVSSVDVRGVQLATIFNRAITHFTLVNSVCGDPLHSKLVSDSSNNCFLFHKNQFSSPSFKITKMLKRNVSNILNSCFRLDILIYLMENYSRHYI